MELKDLRRSSKLDRDWMGGVALRLRMVGAFWDNLELGIMSFFVHRFGVCLSYECPLSKLGGVAY